MREATHSARSLVVGTRGSALAMTQTRWVVDSLQRFSPELRVRIETIRTEGDVSATAPLWKIGGEGIFVNEIERALETGSIDFAVHSLKDLPSTIPDGLLLAAVPEREDPRDVLVSGHGLALAFLPPGARVGTSSSRRRAQLLAFRPDLRIVALRGNVDTRLRKAEAEDLDAIVIAAAGLARLGYLDRVTEYLDPSICLPAPGQGALAIQIRSDDRWLMERLSPLDHLPSRAEIDAERVFLAEMGGGCQLPMAALARVSSGHLDLNVLAASPDGKRTVKAATRGSLAEAAALGSRAAEELKALGAMELMEESGDDR